MKVVILAGGKGTRMREETEYRPKPMVEIGGRPIMWHIMKHYAHYGFNDFVICLGYKGSMIKEYFLNYEPMNNDFTVQLGGKKNITYHNTHNEQDFSVTLAETGLDSMTGSRVKQIERYIDGDTFMVAYGDGVSNLDVNALLDCHKKHGKIATLTTIQPVSRFGTLKLDEQGNVNEFVEKPKLNDWISTGFFVFNRQIFDYLSDDPNCVLETTPLENLAKAGELVAYRHEGVYFMMDTYREYTQLNELWDKGEASWKVW